MGSQVQGKSVGRGPIHWVGSYERILAPQRETDEARYYGTYEKGNTMWVLSRDLDRKTKTGSKYKTLGTV